MLRKKNRLPSTKWGLVKKVVLQWMECLPTTLTYHLFVGNYFTSFHLLTLLGAWRYNKKQEEKLIHLYWNNCVSASRCFYYKKVVWNFKYYHVQIGKVSCWFTSKQSMSKHVSLCQDMHFLWAFPWQLVILRYCMQAESLEAINDTTRDLKDLWRKI